MSTFTKYAHGSKARQICIWSPGITSRALEILRRHLNCRLFDAADYDKATLCYTQLCTSDPDDAGNYALRFYSRNRENEIWLSGVTSGYRGEGPAGTVAALKLMGFNIDEEEVYCLPMGQGLSFTKD